MMEKVSGSGLFSLPGLIGKKLQDQPGDWFCQQAATKNVSRFEPQRLHGNRGSVPSVEKSLRCLNCNNVTTSGLNVTINPNILDETDLGNVTTIEEVANHPSFQKFLASQLQLFYTFVVNSTSSGLFPYSKITNDANESSLCSGSTVRIGEKATRRNFATGTSIPKSSLRKGENLQTSLIPSSSDSESTQKNPTGKSRVHRSVRQRRENLQTSLIPSSSESESTQKNPIGKTRVHRSARQRGENLQTSLIPSSSDSESTQKNPIGKTRVHRSARQRGENLQTSLIPSSSESESTQKNPIGKTRVHRSARQRGENLQTSLIPSSSDSESTQKNPIGKTRVHRSARQRGENLQTSLISSSSESESTQKNPIGRTRAHKSAPQRGENLQTPLIPPSSESESTQRQKNFHSKTIPKGRPSSQAEPSIETARSILLNTRPVDHDQKKGSREGHNILNVHNSERAEPHPVSDSNNAFSHTGSRSKKQPGSIGSVDGTTTNAEPEILSDGVFKIPEVPKKSAKARSEVSTEGSSQVSLYHSKRGRAVKPPGEYWRLRTGCQDGSKNAASSDAAGLVESSSVQTSANTGVKRKENSLKRPDEQAEDSGNRPKQKRQRGTARSDKSEPLLKESVETQQINENTRKAPNARTMEKETSGRKPAKKTDSRTGTKYPKSVLSDTSQKDVTTKESTDVPGKQSKGKSSKTEVTTSGSQGQKYPHLKVKLERLNVAKIPVSSRNDAQPKKISEALERRRGFFESSDDEDETCNGTAENKEYVDIHRKRMENGVNDALRNTLALERSRVSVLDDSSEEEPSQDVNGLLDDSPKTHVIPVRTAWNMPPKDGKPYRVPPRCMDSISIDTSPKINPDQRSKVGNKGRYLFVGSSSEDEDDDGWLLTNQRWKPSRKRMQDLRLGSDDSYCSDQAAGSRTRTLAKSVGIRSREDSGTKHGKNLTIFHVDDWSSSKSGFQDVKKRPRLVSEFQVAVS